MLPNVRLVLATTAAALLVVSLGLGLLSASRTASVFPIGLRSAKGSPIERALPEPPDWKQFVALAAARRAEELNRLIELPGAAPGSLPDASAPGGIERGATHEAAAEPAANAAPAVRQ